MLIVPISRQELLNKRAEQARIDEEVGNIASRIYMGAVQAATTTNFTSFQFAEFSCTNQGKFIRAHSSEILNRLSYLFPDCTINYNILAFDTNLIVHDITYLDLNNLPFVITPYLSQECILVDWSREIVIV